ncbi:hypothetical protein Ddye_028078 [Dipteronia dyeriana]|uniref:ADP-ribosyl cyclase/cyclic ADP-ribose hydrolase n=1 Tax=Dipteronia dyeriana TaxID=168575 RepID=A0AAD9TR67_9ROSI|nr:hypothetical protein Ddye_028078 [Dipteronia dyeriana]
MSTLFYKLHIQCFEIILLLLAFCFSQPHFPTFDHQFFFTTTKNKKKGFSCIVACNFCCSNQILQFFSMGNLQTTPSSSTTTTFQKKYDVFLNFRGEDTRNCFTCHLYKALHTKIETFIDDGLEKGDDIWPTLKGVIEQSKISVVILSKDYASSKWCLRELVQIMEHKNMNNQIVIPIFYRVDPSDVRKQTGSFEDSFDKHGKESQEEVQKWREALTEASNLSGWDSSVTKPDTTLVDQIVKDIRKKLMGECISHDFGALIGHKRIKQVISLLCLHDVRINVQIIGIWGMGGIGKTTIADAIFIKSSNQFEGVCFNQNVRERLQNSGGLVSLQKEILSKILKDEDLKLDGPTIPSIIKERLNCTKVLIVFDDVDDYLPLENLARGVDRLGLGSRIIITSRDKHVLQLCRVNDQNIYEVDGFNDHDALQLFCNYAFDKNYPPEDHTVLSNELLNYSKGNPLALKVLGSSLYRKSKQEWESVVNTLRTTKLKSGIFDVLKISYDGLEDSEKNIFLDIACFLKGKDRDYVAKILGDCSYSLCVLDDKSLITISSYGRIQMHDLLEEMGREIVDKESPNKPGKRSRLWRQEEVQNTLKYDEGTNAVQGIVLDLSKIKDMQLSFQAFKKMYNLRFLQFYDSWDIQFYKVHFPNGLSDLSGKLRSLVWIGFPLTTLPSNFNPENLVELNLRDSNLERLWKGTMHASNLKLLILPGCKRLTIIPDLSDAPLLEVIDLRHCRSLLDFPKLAQHLKNLTKLDLWGCESLRSFPSDIHFESLKSLELLYCDNLTKFPEISGYLSVLDLCGAAIDEVPPSIGSLIFLSNLNLSQCTRLKYISTNICKLKSLEELNLENCSELEVFPEILETMECLQVLELSGTAIKELPHSIEHLNGLKKLYLRRCKNLEQLPSSICNLTSLRILKLSDCPKLEIFSDELEILFSFGCRGLRFTHSSGFPCSLTNLCLSACNLKEIPEDICHLSSLVVLDLSGNNFESLPTSTKQLSNLEYLDVNNCNMLQSLTELPLSIKILSASDCKQLRSILLEASELVDTIFIFTNCPNLEETAVGNIFAAVEGYEGELGLFTFCCLGSEVPGWFSYKSNESSIKFRMACHDCFNGLQGFIVCAVIEFEEYRFDANDGKGLFVGCRWTICDGVGFYQVTEFSSYILVAASRFGTLIDSDILALWYCKALVHQVLNSLITNELNFSFEFLLAEGTPNCRVKSCGVRPITKIPNEDDKVKHAESIKTFGVTIKDIGETS